LALAGAGSGADAGSGAGARAAAAAAAKARSLSARGGGPRLRGGAYSQALPRRAHSAQGRPPSQRTRQERHRVHAARADMAAAGENGEEEMDA